MSANLSSEYDSPPAMATGYLASQNGGAASEGSGKSSGPNPTANIQQQPRARGEWGYETPEPVPANAIEHSWYAGMINSLGECFGTLGAIPVCFCFPTIYRRVDQGSVGLVTRFGKYTRMTEPGLTRVNPFSERMYTVDVKVQVLMVPEQSCITKDNVNLTLSSVIYYHIVVPERAAFNVQDVRVALTERTQTTLRHVVGARVLQHLIERREEVAASIREIIDEVAEKAFGVKVESILIKDLHLSRELQESLSMAAQAKRIGESKIIAAEAEVKAAQLMRKTAALLSSPAAMSIRMYEAQQAIARTAGSKVIFLPGSPFPGGPSNYGQGAAVVQDDDDDDNNNNNSTEMSNLLSKTVMDHM